MRNTNIPLGIAVIVLSSMLFAPTSQTATKFLAGTFPLWQILFFRSLGQTAWMLIFFWPKERGNLFRTRHLGMHLLRSTLLFASTICWTSAIASVPLATASSINFTAPIMVVMLSIPLLGEKVGKHRWGAILVGFIGALVVIQPGRGSIPNEVFLLLLAAFLFALYQILTRRVTGTDSAATTSVYTVVVALVVSTFVVPFHYQAPAPGEYIIWLAFLATGLLGGIRHYLVIKAYEIAPASIISPFFYVELVGVALLGFVVFGDIPEPMTWLGAGIIVSSGIYIAHRERVTAK